LIKNLFIIGAGFTDTDDLIAMQEGRDVLATAFTPKET